MSRASEMFDAERRFLHLEDALEDDLARACGFDPREFELLPWKNIVHDDYDNSFEFKGVAGDWTPTPEQLDACWALGFSRCWICYAEGAMQKRIITAQGEEIREYPREKFFAAPALQREFPGEPESSRTEPQ